MRTHDEVIAAFTPVGKLDETMRMKVLKLENAFKDLATDMLDLIPDSADRTAALRKLLEVKQGATHAVTHFKAPVPPTNRPVQTNSPKEAHSEKAS